MRFVSAMFPVECECVGRTLRACGVGEDQVRMCDVVVNQSWM